MAMARAALAVVLIALAATRLPGQSHERDTPAGTSSHPLAPEFSLTDLDGHTLRIADYRGKVVLLDFWATWCVPCRTEIPRFVQWQKQYGEKGFQVIGIALDDSPAPVRKFARIFHINYPIAMGDAKVAEAYGGILGLPVNLLIGRDGRVHAKSTGDTDLRSLEAQVGELLEVKHSAR